MNIMSILGDINLPTKTTLDTHNDIELIEGDILLECYSIMLAGEREHQAVLESEEILEAAGSGSKIVRIIKSVIKKIITVVKKIGTFIINYIPDVLKTYLFLADQALDLKVIKWLRQRFRLRAERDVYVRVLLDTINRYRTVVEDASKKLLHAIAISEAADVDRITVVDIVGDFKKAKEERKPVVIPFDINADKVNEMNDSEGVHSVLIASLSKSEIKKVFSALDFPDVTKDVFKGFEKSIEETEKKLIESSSISQTDINKWSAACTTKLKQFIEMVTTVTKFFADIIKTNKTTITIINNEFKKEGSENE